MISTSCRAALLALLVALLSCVTAVRAQVDPAVAKKLAKLEAKLAKHEAKLDTALTTAADYAAQLSAANDQLAVAQLLPEGTPAELKAKKKAQKLAQKLVKKLAKKVTKWNGKANKETASVQGLMAAIELLVPGYFDDSTSGDGGDDGSGGDGGGGVGGDGDGGGGSGGDGGGGDPTGGGTVLDPALAQPLLSVDCGDLNGYPSLEAGYVLLSKTSAPPGVALTPAALDTVHVAHFFSIAGIVAFPSSVVALDPDQVGERRKLTSLVLANPTTLTLSGLPPDTDLSVLLELGATAPWVELVNGAWTGISSSTHGLRVERDGPAAGTQWQTVARYLRCGTSLSASSFQTDSGAILPLWVSGTTDGAGKLALRLSSEESTPVLLAAFRVYRREALPIVYRRTASGPLQTDSAACAAFVAAFNAGDLDAAESQALALADDLQRGVALLHLAGWLDGSRDGRLALLPAARTALSAAQLEGHAAASLLLEQLDHLQRALAHFDARGYSHSQLCAADGGTGFLNPACAGQIYSKLGQADSNVNFQIGLRELRGLVAGGSGPTALSDLAAWNAGALDGTGYEPSPLVFLALKEYAVELVTMNPLLGVDPSNPESATTLDSARAIFDGFVDQGFAAADFPHDHELALFKAYVDAGVHPKDWDASALALFTDQQLADAWWGAQVVLQPDVAAAPAWANAERNVQRMLRHFIGEWMELRLVHDELGGGQGDDVELLLQFFPLLTARHEAGERLLRTRVDDLVHYGLEESGTVVDGYWAGNIADVEHTSEYGTDPLLASRGIFRDTARTAILGALDGRHILDPADPSQAFAGTSNAGRTHFLSYWYTTDGPSDNALYALDEFLNGRSMVPAVTLAQRGSLASSHPLNLALRAWAAGWRDDALLAPAAALGKPLGFPAPAQWPSNTLGTGGLWYTQKALAGDTSIWTTGEISYVFGLLRAAYRQSVAADRWQFLLPAVRMFRAVAAWEDAGQQAGAAGSEAWAAAQLRNGARFGPIVLDNLSDLASDTTLTTTTDPVLGNTTYVDSALVARMHTWVETAFTDQGPVLHYALPDVGTCVGHELKNTEAFTNVLENEQTYLRNVWPILCRHAMHTDRVAVSIDGLQRELVAAFTGTTLVEGQPFTPLVRWSGAGLDLAVLTNHRDAAGTAWSAFAYNFAGAPATVALTLDAGLQPGSWLLEVGSATATCDIFPSGVTTSVMVTKRGLAATVSVTLAPGMNLVRLTRTGAAAAAQAFDLLLDPPRLVTAGGGALALKVRVVNAGAVAAPASSLDLYMQAVDAEGGTVSVPALPSEELLSSATLTLGAATGFVLPEQTVTVYLPSGSPLVALLQSGLGLQVRARISSTADEWDPANNEQARCWFAADIDPDE